MGEGVSGVSVVADDREAGGAAVARLRQLGVAVEAKRIPVGDFILSPRIGVERKTAADFESSVVDGRLFAQARDLAATFESPIICIVGNAFERIDQKARRGAFMALAVDYRIPVFFFETESSFGDFLHQLAWREQARPPREEKLNFNKHTLDGNQQKQLVVEALPGVGPKLAKLLLEHFGTVENVFTADEDELLEVEGIGPEKARAIRRLLDAYYLSKEAESEKEKI